MLENGLTTLNSLDDLFKKQTDNFSQLIQLLQTNTFKKNASFFSLSGRVLSANLLMIDEKEKFAPVLQALGELDACLSIAKLYQSMQHERVSYCFVNFKDAPKPFISIKNFWNPFINHNIVVPNSLEMGNDQAAKIILTGSNTGGKSTILKALMMSLLLGQTFGIAPAQECCFSPFAFIGSYLRVNDDTAADQSKFKAEVLRAKMLCQTMESLLPNQFGFVVIDELFTGTSSTNAANAASKVAQKLAFFDNNLYILATHFPLLTELEKTNEGLIKNYKVDIYKDEDGNLVRPFKLEAGISSSNVAQDILTEAIQNIDFTF